MDVHGKKKGVKNILCVRKEARKEVKSVEVGYKIKSDYLSLIVRLNKEKENGIRKSGRERQKRKWRKVMWNEEGTERFRN